MEDVMKKLLVLPLILIFSGCAQNHFNVPTKNFNEKVRILGVAPIMIDADSEIKHPQKVELITLAAEMNRIFEPYLISKLRETGNFFNVALLDSDPRQIFAELFFRREKRDDATIRYNKYFWNPGGLRDYIRKNNLDAVMCIMVSGISMSDKVYSSNLLKSKTSDYNYLIMTAQILDADGTILWEYPNFRNRILTFDPMINLQYPDFSESDANLADDVNVKFKTIEGIKRALNLKRKSILLRETKESEIYGKQFDEMLSFLKYTPEKDKKDASGMREKPVELPVSQEKSETGGQQLNAPIGRQPVDTSPASTPPTAPATQAIVPVIPAPATAPSPPPTVEPPLAPVTPSPVIPVVEPLKPAGN